MLNFEEVKDRTYKHQTPYIYTYKYISLLKFMFLDIELHYVAFVLKTHLMHIRDVIYFGRSANREDTWRKIYICKIHYI